MKYITEFRDPEKARALANLIEKESKKNQQYRLMEFCGGHTHAIHRYGIVSLLPENVQLIHGPGCPVCVLPIARIDHAIALAKLPNIIFCTYGDMLRVPATKQQTLFSAKAQGADIRMVYSTNDALEIARKNPDRQVVFFAIGFETTTPPTALALKTAKFENLENFSVFCNHVLTPVAMQCLLESDESPNLDGFIGPAHVSIIIGSDAYLHVALHYKKPVVISGFEPLDLMQSILMLIRLINAKEYGVKNQYTRAVNASGSHKSQQIIEETMIIRDQFEWRGLGWMLRSAMQIHPQYRLFDAEVKFPMKINRGEEHKACDCGRVLRGLQSPLDCKVFATVCTPENPLGACMVSSEGACAAYYAYGQKGERAG
ncbi:MAG: hydrogenase formation protein HypD [Legionellales bacterium]|nr:hydrogenase formation protein HypD [Legionellales bacterium]